MVAQIGPSSDLAERQFAAALDRIRNGEDALRDSALVARTTGDAASPGCWDVGL